MLGIGAVLSMWPKRAMAAAGATAVVSLDFGMNPIDEVTDIVTESESEIIVATKKISPKNLVLQCMVVNILKWLYRRFTY